MAAVQGLMEAAGFSGFSHGGSAAAGGGGGGGGGNSLLEQARAVLHASAAARAAGGGGAGGVGGVGGSPRVRPFRSRRDTAKDLMDAAQHALGLSPRGSGEGTSEGTSGGGGGGNSLLDQARALIQSSMPEDRSPRAGGAGGVGRAAVTARPDDTAFGPLEPRPDPLQPEHEGLTPRRLEYRDSAFGGSGLDAEGLAARRDSAFGGSGMAREGTAARRDSAFGGSGQLRAADEGAAAEGAGARRAAMQDRELYELD